MKNKDYGDIEKILENKANRLEKSVSYSGAVRDSKDTARMEKNKEKKKVSFDFPGRQLVAAVLAMVIVGAGTFGTLKYLEVVGAKRLAEQGNADTSEQPQGTGDNKGGVQDAVHDGQVRNDLFGGVVHIRLESRNIDDPLELDLDLAHDCVGILQKYSDEADQLGFNIYSYSVPDQTGTFGGLCVLSKDSGELVMDFEPADMIKPPVELWYAEDTPSGHPTFFFTATQTFSGRAYGCTYLFAYDLQTKQQQLIAKTDLDKYFGIKGAIEGGISYDSENQTLNFEILRYDPWSDMHVTGMLKKGTVKYGDGKYSVFYDDKIDMFDGVCRIDLSDTGEELKLDLPTDLKFDYKNVREVVNVPDVFDYKIYTYEAKDTENGWGGICIVDGKGGLVMNFEPQPMVKPSNELWYAEITPSGHPMLFFVSQRVNKAPGTSYGAGKKTIIFTYLYAYDLTTRERSLISYVDSTSGGTDGGYRGGDLSYDEANKQILLNTFKYTVLSYLSSWPLYDENTERNRELVRSDAIYWNGDVYVVLNNLVTVPEPETKAVENWRYDPRGYLKVVSGGASYEPVLIRFEGVDSEHTYDETYNDELPVIEYGKPFEINNGVRMHMSFLCGTVGDNDSFNTLDSLIEGINSRAKSAKTDTEVKVCVTVSWDNDQSLGYYSEFEFGFILKIKANAEQTKTPVDVKPATEENFLVIYGDDAIAPVKYAEWTVEENEQRNKKYYPADDVPVLDLYGAPESKRVIYQFDNEKITPYETVIGRWNYCNTQKLGAYCDITYSLINLTKQDTVFTTTAYVEAIFERNDGSGKYVSFVFAVSAGGPKCYPYSDEGDGPADLTVSDGENTYAPKAERIQVKNYDPDIDNHSKYNFAAPGYYKVPELSADGKIEINMKKGYHIEHIIAYPDADSIEQQVLHDVSGKHYSTWLHTLPWEEYYAAIVVTGDDGNEEFRIQKDNDYRIAYVIKIRNSGGKQTEKIDHTALISELEGWLSQRMWNGMTEEDLLNTATDDKELKRAIIASATDQKNEETDGTFIRYKEQYCDFLYFAEKDTFKIREARLMFRPGSTFSLPFGISLDMNPEKALLMMGYTEEQISSLKGKTEREGDFTLNYTGDYLTITYVYNGAALGIELGSGANAYIEMG